MINNKKVVLVTGGATGIGKEIVRLLSKDYIVIINYYNSIDEAEELYNELISLNRECMCIRADVSNEEEVDHLVRIVEEKYNGIDIIINNAGIDKSNLFGLNSINIFKETLEVNLLGAYILSKRCYKYMLQNKWGRIINISSTNGDNTYYPMSIEYDASKAALNSLTHNLSMQFGPYINVNAIAPGFIGTEKELDGYDEEFLKEETNKIFKKRYGNPIEVAYLVEFLISDKADYINNQVIKIDGGQYGD